MAGIDAMPQSARALGSFQVTGCCDPGDYRRVFTPARAGRTVRRYLARGLDGTAADLAQAVAAHGVAGATLLEIGGGAGTIHVDLLRGGAASAVNVELSPGWEAAAAELLAGLDLADRVQRLVGDFVTTADTQQPADVVILHRVVCCYPHWKPMLAAAGRLAGRVVGLTVPVDRWWTIVAIAVGNRFFGLTGCGFRGFVHPIAPMLGALATAGFQVSHDRSGAIWRTVVLTRA